MDSSLGKKQEDVAVLAEAINDGESRQYAKIGGLYPVVPSKAMNNIKWQCTLFSFNFSINSNGNF